MISTRKRTVVIYLQLLVFCWILGAGGGIAFGKETVRLVPKWEVARIMKYAVTSHLRARDGTKTYDGEARFNVAYLIKKKSSKGLEVWVRRTGHSLTHTDIYGRRNTHRLADVGASILVSRSGKVTVPDKNDGQSFLAVLPHAVIDGLGKRSAVAVGTTWTVAERLTDEVLCPDGIVVRTTWALTASTSRGGKRVAILTGTSSGETSNSTDQIDKVSVRRDARIEWSIDEGQVLSLTSNVDLQAQGKQGKTFSATSKTTMVHEGWTLAGAAGQRGVHADGRSLGKCGRAEDSREATSCCAVARPTLGGCLVVLAVCSGVVVLLSRTKAGLVMLLILGLLLAPLPQQVRAQAAVSSQRFVGYYNGQEVWFNSQGFAAKEPLGMQWRWNGRLSQEYAGYNKSANIEYWRSPFTGQIQASEPPLCPGSPTSPLVRWCVGLPVTGSLDASEAALYAAGTDSLMNFWAYVDGKIGAEQVVIVPQLPGEEREKPWWATWWGLAIIGGATAGGIIAGCHDHDDHHERRICGGCDDGGNGGYDCDDDGDNGDDGGSGGNGGLSDVTVSQRDITLAVWDHQLIDGDQIDLIVNGTYILSDHVLTRRPGTSANVTLNQGRNTVIVHADNVGSQQPNTATLEISNVTSGQSVQQWSVHMGQDASLVISAP
jgi:hypothetical protein